MADCKHDGEKRNEVTKSDVYLVCKECGKRLKKLDSRLLIEKVVVPETFDKTVTWMEDQLRRVF